MPLGQVTAAGLPDTDDRGPAGRVPAARLGGRRELGVGCDQQPQPGRLPRGEPVHQVVQVVMVMRRCHAHQSTASLVDQGAKPGQERLTRTGHQAALRAQASSMKGRPVGGR